MNIVEELTLTVVNVCAQTLITLPLDNVKLVQQLNSEKNLNLIEAAQHIYKCTGFQGFYAGLYTRVWTTIPDELSQKVVQYVDIKDRMKSMLSVTDDSGLLKVVVSGTVADIPTIMLKYPTEMLRDNELLPVLGKKERSSEEVVQISLGYPALATSILSVALYRAVYFTTSDIGKKSGWDQSLVSAMTRIIAGYLVYPLDTIRRTQHLSALGALEDDAKVESIQDAYNYIVEKDGVLGLWKGANANVLKSFVAEWSKNAVPDFSTIYKNFMYPSA